MIDTPSGGAPEMAPRWDLVDTESYGPTMVEGAPRGGVGVRLPRALLVAFLT